MPDNKWEKLETELKKDFWGKSEACHIFAGLIRVVRRESIKPSLQIVEEKQTIRAKEREQDRIKEVWDGTDHQPKGREIRSNGFTEEYSVAYCIRWAQKKRINIPWLNWAIKEGYIKAEDLEPENNNADADRVPGSDAAVTEEESENTVKNRLRLIGLMANLMIDEKTVKAVPFKDQKQLATFIANYYKDDYPNRGLAVGTVSKLLAKANNVLSEDKVDKD
jgi:hypothetical protein